jgi:hypothetical protein
MIKQNRLTDESTEGVKFGFDGSEIVVETIGEMLEFLGEY